MGAGVMWDEWVEGLKAPKAEAEAGVPGLAQALTTRYVKGAAEFMLDRVKGWRDTKNSTPNGPAELVRVITWKHWYALQKSEAGRPSEEFVSRVAKAGHVNWGGVARWRYAIPYEVDVDDLLGIERGVFVVPRGEDAKTFVASRANIELARREYSLEDFLV